MMSSYTTPPQSPLMASMKAWPYPVDPRGLGIKTTNPAPAKTWAFPAITPLFSPSPLRAAVHEQQQGILLFVIEAGRLDDKSVYLRAVTGLVGDLLEGSDLMFPKDFVVEMGELPRPPAGREATKDLGRVRAAMAAIDDRLAVGSELDVPVCRIAKDDRLNAAAGRRHGVDRASGRGPRR